MASISNSTSMSFRVDKDLKKESDKLFKKLGLNTSAAINMFLSQSVREQAIPFNVQSEVPNRKLRKALKEVEKYEKGKIKLKGYDNMTDLIKSLEED